MIEVSVIMSTYNETLEELREAIESVRKQTFTDYEFLIVLDNPQNHEIRNCIEEYAAKDCRIKMIANEKNMGLTKSLNKAIQQAQGIYMSRLDADDIMQNRCLELELDTIKKEKLDLVCGSKINIDEDGNTLGSYIDSFSPRQIKKLLPYDNSINHSTVMVRLDAVRKENGYREIPSCEDYDLWIRLLGHGFRMKKLPDILLYYRVRKKGIVQSNVYKMYCSKHFVMDLYKKSLRNKDILEDSKAYERFMNQWKVSELSRDKFNQAYGYLIKGMEFAKKKKVVIGCRYIFGSFLMDKAMINFVLEKISYRIRKQIVVVFNR